jgi:hypothetical protein
VLRSEGKGADNWQLCSTRRDESCDTAPALFDILKISFPITSFTFEHSNFDFSLTIIKITITPKWVSAFNDHYDLNQGTDFRRATESPRQGKSVIFYTKHTRRYMFGPTEFAQHTIGDRENLPL